jgi:hypothetical protein
MKKPLVRTCNTLTVDGPKLYVATDANGMDHAVWATSKKVSRVLRSSQVVLLDPDPKKGAVHIVCLNEKTPMEEVIAAAQNYEMNEKQVEWCMIAVQVLTRRMFGSPTITLMN